MKSFSHNVFFIRIIQILSVLILIGIVTGIYFILLYFPVPTSPYNRATLYYKKGYYHESIEELLTVPVKKQTIDTKILLGWNYYHIKEFKRANQVFREVLALDPESEDALLGLSNIALSDHDPKTALFFLNQLLSKNPSKGEYRLLLGDIYYRQGNNIGAAEVFRKLIAENTEKKEATKRFLAITGFPEYRPDLSLSLQGIQRPDTRWIRFRAQDKNYIEVKNDGKWEFVYLKGVNLSGALPGHFVTETPKEVEPYLEWFKQISEMNCNLIRIYNRHYPAFYRALKMHNTASAQKIWVIQEIWLEERDPDLEDKEEVYDLYDASWTEGFVKELQNAVDVIHGNADIPFARGRSAGLYSADISEYVLAFGIGREVEPYIVIETNQKNASETHYKGSYISMPEGTPTEKWFAAMYDWIANYEINTYNAERPLMQVNWPPLDAIRHPTESSYADAEKWSNKYGIQLPTLTKKQKAKGTFEADVASIDITKFKVSPSFEAGIFASYNVYGHWPHFMYEMYQDAYDEIGRNPFYGYLLDLKSHYKNMPVLIGEYGIPTSWTPIIRPHNSFNYGGYNEQEQAELLTRQTYNIQKAKYAGGLIFEFHDGWWKREVALYPFVLFDRKPYWYNAVDPEEGYGLEGYHAPFPIPLLRGETSDWKYADLLSKKEFFSSASSGSLKKVYGFSDETFFYLRIDVKPWKNEADLDWNHQEYWIGLSTLPEKFGSQLLPDISFYVHSGINFLIKLKGPEASEILISENYNPFFWSTLHLASVSEEIINFKNEMLPKVEIVSPFGPIYFPGTLWHFSKDGKIVNPAPINRSRLFFGTAELEEHQYASLSACHINYKQGMIEIRIPWGLLYMMDPSTRLAFGGIQGTHQLAADIEGSPMETPGFGVVVLDVQSAGEEKIFQGSLPQSDKKALSSDQLPIYQWPKWTMPRYKSYLKESYFKMKEVYKNLDIPNER